jgi:hypothetical protein
MSSTLRPVQPLFREGFSAGGRPFRIAGTATVTSVEELVNQKVPHGESTLVFVAQSDGPHPGMGSERERDRQARLGGIIEGAMDYPGLWRCPHA